MAKQKKRVNGIVVGQLRGIVARLERLAESRAQISEDTKVVMAEAKAVGYDTKIIRMLLKERTRDQGEIAEEAEMLRIYREALGMEGTPLAKWAESKSDEDPEPEPEPARAAKASPKKRAAKISDEIAATQGLSALDPVTRAAMAWGKPEGDGEQAPS